MLLDPIMKSAILLTIANHTNRNVSDLELTEAIILNIAHLAVLNNWAIEAYQVPYGDVTLRFVEKPK